MGESRHNQDRLLKAIQADEENRNKGHLKIFFGYAAGVGKTYAMLEAAHMEKQQGIDVVAGYVEPHARPKTAALSPNSSSVIILLTSTGLVSSQTAP